MLRGLSTIGHTCSLSSWFARYSDSCHLCIQLPQMKMPPYLITGPLHHRLSRRVEWTLTPSLTDTTTALLPLTRLVVYMCIYATIEQKPTVLTGVSYCTCDAFLTRSALCTHFFHSELWAWNVGVSSCCHGGSCVPVQLEPVEQGKWTESICIAVYRGQRWWWGNG